MRLNDYLMASSFWTEVWAVFAAAPVGAQLLTLGCFAAGLYLAAKLSLCCQLVMGDCRVIIETVQRCATPLEADCDAVAEALCDVAGWEGNHDPRG